VVNPVAAFDSRAKDHGQPCGTIGSEIWQRGRRSLENPYVVRCTMKKVGGGPAERLAGLAAVVVMTSAEQGVQVRMRHSSAGLFSSCEPY